MLELGSDGPNRSKLNVVTMPRRSEASKSQAVLDVIEGITNSMFRPGVLGNGGCNGCVGQYFVAKYIKRRKSFVQCLVELFILQPCSEQTFRWHCSFV